MVNIHKKECCRDDTRALTHGFVSTASTKKIFRTGHKMLEIALIKYWRGHDMYVTQYIYIYSDENKL